MRRETAYLLVLILFGSAAVEFQLRQPSWNFQLAYDTRAIDRARLKVPRYALVLGYDNRWLETILARLGLPDTARRVSALHGAMRSPAGTAEPKLNPSGQAEKKSATAPPAVQRFASPVELATPQVQPEIKKPDPALDFAKIAPDGTSVIAGHAEPGARVTVLEGDKSVGTATAGPDGDWSLSTDHKFASPDPELALRAETGPQNSPAARVPTPEDTAKVAELIPPNPSAAAAASPAAKLVDEFKETVEAARQESKEQEAVAAQALSKPANTGTDTATAPAVEWPVVAGPPASEQKPLPENEKRAEAAKAEVQPATNIPIPMQFVYKEAKLTDDGRRAVSLLLEYLTLKKFEAVTLSGHADERGSEHGNMKLARARLVAIKQRLREAGYDGKIELLPKGESEPYARVDRTKLTREELMQLDRRVELRVAH